MKRSVLIVILLILLSFGLYLGAAGSRRQEQPATIVFDMTDANEGGHNEQAKTNPVVFGAELSAQRMLSPADRCRPNSCRA